MRRCTFLCQCALKPSPRSPRFNLYRGQRSYSNGSKPFKSPPKLDDKTSAPSRPASQQSLSRRPGLGIAGWTGAALVAVLAIDSIYTRFFSRTSSGPDPSTLPLLASPKPIHDLSGPNLAAAQQEFLAILGPDGVSTSPSQLTSHSSTEWSPSPTNITPSLILYPRSTTDVSAILRICHRRRIPVTPFSGGTSLEGALASTRGGVVLSFRNMARVLTVHEADLDAVVQPGVGWEAVNAHLAEMGSGLFFPVDPGPGACIGGMVGTGCSGTNASRYGTMRDWVLSLTVVLADGTVVKTRRRARKSVAGYDLARLVVGSSGTLAVVTEATLKLAAAPRNVRVAVVGFDSTKRAVESVGEFVRRDLNLGAIELLDENIMRGINSSQGLEGRAAHAESPTLFLKFSGTAPEAVEAQIRAVREIVKTKGAKSITFAKDEAEGAALWQARKIALLSFLSMKRDPKDQFIGADVAVPLSRLAEIVDESKAKMAASGLWGHTIGHVGDGNFHIGICYPRAQKAVAKGIIDEMQRRAIQMEGTITGEHGIGLYLRDVLQEEVGVNAIDMMRKIKHALDPRCILNCDKVLRMEERDEYDKSVGA